MDFVNGKCQFEINSSLRTLQYIKKVWTQFSAFFLCILTLRLGWISKPQKGECQILENDSKSEERHLVNFCKKQIDPFGKSKNCFFKTFKTVSFAVCRTRHSQLPNPLLCSHWQKKKFGASPGSPAQPNLATSHQIHVN